MGKRLFIAVDIDEPTRVQVDRISAGVRVAIEQHAKASWVRADRMHLTLHFLGHVDATMEDRVRDALAQPLRVAPFAIAFDRLGFFPERGSPRVLWLGIRDGLEPLRRIHDELADRLDLKPEREGPYTPHLTLARFRDRIPRGRLAELGRIQASAGPSRIERVTLYESSLSPAPLDLRSGRPEVARRAGPTYVPLATAQLER